MMRFLLLIFSAMFCFSCAQKQTKIILLPQDSGEVGAVTMSAGDSTVTLDKPYMVSQSGKMQVSQADPKAIQSAYGDLFKMELRRPAPPVMKEPEKDVIRFNLFFLSNSLELTTTSKEKIKEIITLLKKTPPTRIRVVGYTDTVGSKASNLTLSSQRADKISKHLNQMDNHTNRMEIRGYGEHGLMVFTEDDTPEPRNRRVKVFIY